MIKLETIFSSNIPVDCHIVKGRLETEGIDCFIFDENIIWVHPFKAVAIGGVKLKVPSDQIQLANEIIDENGKNDLTSALETEILRQNEILKIRVLIREHSGLSLKKSDFRSTHLNQTEINEIIENEEEIKKLSEQQFIFTWKQFWIELFDPERNFFSYFRTKQAGYYIENDLVENYKLEPHEDSDIFCPNCHSENVRYGNAIDFKSDILYIVLSFLVYAPFPLYRKNYYCFECKTSFKRKQVAYSTQSNP
jgi:hypothetical protein